MRLKTFSAPSMSEAMTLVKGHFGDNAIIVSSQKAEDGFGVRITAAVESPEVDIGFEGEPTFLDIDDPLDTINDALAHHGAPPALAEKLLSVAGDLGLEDTNVAFAASIDQVFTFAQLPETSKPGIFMLVGLPGAGKTVTTAKLATQAVLAKQPVNVITTDTIRAGGFAQLEAFTRILEVDLLSASDPDTLRDATLASNPKGITLIDCAGGNPFDADDNARQRALNIAVQAEVILILADGTDPHEAADLAHIYAEMGASRLIITRVDTARRHGALLSAAAAGELFLSGISVGPSVTDGLVPLNPVSLARLLLSENEVAAEVLPPPARKSQLRRAEGNKLAEQRRKGAKQQSHSSPSPAKDAWR